MAHRWLQMASNPHVQLKICLFSELLPSTFFIWVNKSRNPKWTRNVWTRDLFLWFILKCTNLSEALFLWPQIEFGIPLTVSCESYKWARVVHRVIFFYPFLYLRAWVDIDIVLDFKSLNTSIWMQCNVQLGDLLVKKPAEAGKATTKVRCRNTTNKFRGCTVVIMLQSWK